jgi:hypothetical protein
MAFAIHHGRWPQNYIDHIDGHGDNNVATYLREASVVESQRNRSRHSNSFGYRGVRRSGNRYTASITVNRQAIRLGTFCLAEVAAEVYAQATRQHFREFARIEED